VGTDFAEVKGRWVFGGGLVVLAVDGLDSGDALCDVTLLSPRRLSEVFSISFGTDSPFTPDDPILGGGSKPITVKAQNPGCYKYDAGAFYSGAIYGMSGGSKPELVILP
jgi:hypothetical protein